jgi:hypothetical protein
VLNIVMFLAAVLALAQFGAYYWRSLIASRAARPLSERFRIATGYESSAPGAQDFGALLSFYRLTPELKKHTYNLCGIQVYYRLAAALQKLPALHRWAQSEMAICTRYVAVLVDLRIERNLAYAAEMRCR